MIKNAELDSLVTSLSLMRKFYSESEITEHGDFKIAQHRYPDMFKDLLNQIGKLERVIASSMEEDDYERFYGHEKVDSRLERLLVLATKHCPKEHHDWGEIIKIADSA